MASISLRSQVLATYRKIMRLSWSWRASVAAKSAEEGAYIRNEARTLFKKNKDVSETNRLLYMVVSFSLGSFIDHGGTDGKSN